MILLNSLILRALFVGVILATVTTAYPQYEDENTQNDANDDIYNPEQLQQRVEADERNSDSLNNMDMDIDMDAKTEVIVKNVRNISDNQLSNEYRSIEHEDKHNLDMTEEVEEDNGDDNTSKEITEQNTKALLREEEYEAKVALSKKNRSGQIFIRTTTTIPQYIRRIEEEIPNITNKNIHSSTFDYADDDEVMNQMLKKHTTTMTSNKNFSGNNDDIVPLAMKYDDEISPGNTPSSRHIEEEVSSEEYYEDEYHEPESTTAIPTALQTPDYNALRTLSSGFTTSATTISTTEATPTPTPAPLTATLAVNIPMIGQSDASLFTTLQPPASAPRSQTQTTLGTKTSRIASAAAAAADKKGKQIPIISTVPFVTTTTTTSSRRRLLPHEQLRNYIEDAYIRMPLAVIVDPSAESLEKTKTLWNDAMRTNFNIKIVLVTLNESEESPAAFNFNNTAQFLTGLNSIKAQNSGDAIRGILHAAELVPYDSAVFISTAQLAKHTDQVQDSAITLLKKRIRLYLIWFGERSLSENETHDSVGGILGEVAIRSGGEILHILSSKNSQELEGSSTLTIVADALRGSQEVDVPVNATLSSLHVKIDKLMRRAVLETPNGEINLKKMVKFKTHTLTTFDDEDKRLDAYVPLTKLRKATVYKLKVVPEDLTTEYSVFIRGERKADTFLDDMIKHFETYILEGHTFYPAHMRNAQLEQRPTTGDGDGTVSTHSKIQFPSDENKSLPKNEVEIFSSQEIHRNSMKSEQNITSSLVVTTAEPQKWNSYILSRKNTKLEMGIHSQILLPPGMFGQLHFEVTNTGYEADYYNIQVVDERRYLTRLTPQRLFLRPGQTSTVTVSVFVPKNTQANTIDHITFSTTTSISTDSLSVNLKVITTVDAQDNTSPSISWDFGSRCESVSSEIDSCSERFWNVYISAQDSQTGIMRLQANPSSGLIYTKAYTVGSTEPLKAIYVSSCCETKVSLIAIDSAGNQRSQTIDVRDFVLTEASIAAIALGAILFILLIILLIAAIIWCCRRRNIVLELPTYTSHSTRNMD